MVSGRFRRRDGALGKLLVHFVCTTDQSICSNSAILGAPDSLSTGVDVSQFVSQLICPQSSYCIWEREGMESVFNI